MRLQRRCPDQPQSYLEALCKGFMKGVSMFEGYSKGGTRSIPRPLNFIKGLRKAYKGLEAAAQGVWKAFVEVL